ncbi:MAG: ABC transporter substrate-binding protein [Hyphomicrobiales bacterium]|nr:ABC transporter substrate-binding protein [Hyphomicrobiales bacterium]
MTEQRFARSLSRRVFTLGTAAAALGAPTIVRAQGLVKVKITQPSESLSYMPIYIGRAKGFFKEAGIDLEVVVTRGDGPDVQALMAKEVEFVATPPHHLYTLYLQNRKLLGIAGILGRCGINMVINKDAAAERNISEDSPFEAKLKSLKGLTFGVSTPGSLTYNMGLYYILRAGLKPQEDAKVVGTGVGTASLAAMSNKIANASMFPSPTADEAVARGFAIWLINNTRGQDPDLKEFLHAVVYVRPDYLNDNTDLCKRLVAVLVRSSAWIRSQPVDEVATALRPFFTSLDEKVFASAVGNVREAVIPDGKMTAAASDAYQKVLLMTGHLKSPVAFDAVFTNKYLPG